MNWLKEILENAKVNEEGKLEVDALLDNIKKAFPEHAVPKSVFNEANTKLKTAEDTISGLKKENKGNEELQQKIKDYETQIGDLREESIKTKKTYALREALKKQGALDPEYIIYKQGGLDKFSFTDEGKPIGIDEILKPIKEEQAFLFKTENPGGGYNPKGGGKPPVNNPWAKDTFNLTEQGKMFKENPVQAKEFAAAAGVSI